MTGDPIEERSREVIIGEIEPPTIVIVDYDDAGPERFRQETGKIRATLGEAALEVEHIGSTAVPGLAAKPIVDTLLVVEDSGDEPSYVPALERADYVLLVRERDFYSTSIGCSEPWRKMCRCTSTHPALWRSTVL